MVASHITETTPVGQLAIDFANTVRQPRVGDAISSPRELHEWLVDAGVLSGDRVSGGDGIRSESRVRSVRGVGSEQDFRSAEGSQSMKEAFPWPPPDGRLVTEEALRLRIDIRHLLSAVSRGEAPVPGSLSTLDRLLERGRWGHQLVFDGRGTSLLKTYADEGPETLLGPIALAAAEIAAYAHPDRLRTCVAAECTKWFLDTSKGGRRRWCSMATCGNRSKAARFRERQAG